MGHSYIEAFPGEIDAFRAFAQDFPGRATFLVDTYDTIRGVERAIEVIKELGLKGRPGIRIDSGNLDRLTRQSRRLLNLSGLEHVRIFVSGGHLELQIAISLCARGPRQVVAASPPTGVLLGVPDAPTTS